MSTDKGGEHCKQTKRGKEFCGQLSRSKTGKTCQRWDSQFPHKHSLDPSRFPEASLKDAANYCRNPDDDTGGPWCYTTDTNKKWEHCDVTQCGKYMHLNEGLFIRMCGQPVFL